MEFLNYHHLRYFWTVAKEGGLTKAAVKLHVSQPTISAQIQALEGVVGEKLFRRVGRGLALTDAGQHVLSYAEEIFSIGADLLSSLKQRPTSRPLRLHLGVADALPKLVAYRIIEPIFRLQHRVQVSCWETKVSDMLVELAAYRLDVVLADEPASSGVNAKVFNHLLGECGVTFCAEAKLARKLKRGFPKSLNGAAALLPMANSGLRRSLEKWFHASGIDLGWLASSKTLLCSMSSRSMASVSSQWQPSWRKKQRLALVLVSLAERVPADSDSTPSRQNASSPILRNRDHFRCTPAFVHQELKVTALDSQKAMAVIPIEKDALDGPGPIEILARVAAQMGEPDRAIAALQKLLSIPIRWRVGCKRAAHSRAAPARSDVRSASE